VGELDNRGSHYYLAMYWAEALARQSTNATLRDSFASIADRLAKNEDNIVSELNAAQGQPIDIGGYYNPDRQLVTKHMRPSPTLNAIIDSIS
jgi:isocitrate dehydrogenase